MWLASGAEAIAWPANVTPQAPFDDTVQCIAAAEARARSCSGRFGVQTLGRSFDRDPRAKRREEPGEVLELADWGTRG
jgi:hypothetical protein